MSYYAVLYGLSDNVTVSLVTAAATIMAALIVLMQRDSTKQRERTEKIVEAVTAPNGNQENLIEKIDEVTKALNVHRDIDTKMHAGHGIELGKMHHQLDHVDDKMQKLDDEVSKLEAEVHNLTEMMMLLTETVMARGERLENLERERLRKNEQNE
jgi:chromosome segregation ATPase